MKRSEIASNQRIINMSKEIQKGVSLLSICSDETVRDDEQPKKAHKRRRVERWIYGFRFKNLHARQIAQKHGLPWKSRPFSTLQKVIDYIEAVSGFSCRFETIDRRREFGNALVIYFAEDDERKRLSKLEATEEEMDRKYGLPWKSRPFSTLQKVIDYIEALSGDSWRLETIPRHRVFGNARVIYFAEDDERKRLSNLEATKEEMDKVRKVLGFPSGTKPKWYCCGGRKECGESADSSDDEVFPGMKPAPSRAPPIEGDSDGDTSDDSDSDMDFDSDRTYDPNEGDGADAEE
ncbi:hypothetical protein A7U60_g5612 [Sanghuangporus baumii]|uniref:Uncharacterized protein n=1 Tax=Sanghuangporus baumii TaxID=108892 RepID=A0A9Q5HWR7_SANBA|nr:hypothetical protein A7U60_g5612 [Sanghuangporus baumii]